MQDGVVKSGYALIIHNTKYKRKDVDSPISSLVVSQFFERFGCKTDLCTDFTTEVMC